MANVEYENLIVAGGRFSNDGADIQTVTVPANTTIARGTLMGQITADEKFVVSLNASSDGSEKGRAIAATEIVNSTGSSVDIEAELYRKGTFNSLGVTFGTGQTIANTKEDLHEVSIEITQGVA